MSFLFAIFIAGYLCIGASGATAEIRDGREIQLSVKNQYAGDDQVWRWDMLLTNKTGYARKRSAYRYMKDRGGLRKIMIRFLSPADIRQTGLLTWENTGADDTQFLYLPALKKIRRIATNDKEQTFVGTDFNYEDLENLKVDNYTYSAAGDDMREGKECYFYEATAKPGANTVYSRMRTWTDKESFIRIH
ncbi:MAG: outer membrane lipoprotein-sorting protein, partial [Candidatus Omnitrophica bacterium]|nr:outer membrane lipoprotein-sorting protein [Candidatus Omnitrophota bacterium]